jgi:hypothetical protein
MRPATAISADGPSKPFNWVSAAINPGCGRARGAGRSGRSYPLCPQRLEIEHDRCTDLPKRERGPAALTNTGAITWFAIPEKKQGMTSGFSIDGLTDLPRADVIYVHAE